MKLTQWFPPTVKPVHKGWYHTGLNNFEPINKYLECGFNWYWNGDEWGFFIEDVFIVSIDQDRYWRGLAK